MDGDTEYLNLKQAERSGFLAPLFYIWQILKRFNLKEGKLTIHVDNIASFHNGNVSQLGEGNLCHHHGDYNLKQLKQMCDESISKHNITVEFMHVKSHQENLQNRTKDKNVEVISLT